MPLLIANRLLTWARISALARRLGLNDEEKAESFIQALVGMKQLQDGKISPEKVAEAILDMAAISKATGIPFIQVPAKFQQLNEAVRKGEEQARIATVKKDEAVAATNAAIRERDEKLKECSITLAALDQYVHDEQELAKYKPVHERPSEAIRVIRHIKEHRPEEKMIIEKLKAIDSLDQRKE